MHMVRLQMTTSGQLSSDIGLVLLSGSFHHKCRSNAAGSQCNMLTKYCFAGLFDGPVLLGSAICIIVDAGQSTVNEDHEGTLAIGSPSPGRNAVGKVWVRASTEQCIPWGHRPQPFIRLLCRLSPPLPKHSAWQEQIAG